MDVIAIILGVIAVIGIGLVLLRTKPAPPPPPDPGIALLQQQLTAFQQRLDHLSQTVTENLQQSTASMNVRLDKAAQVVGDLREKVGQIHEVGKAAAELVNILRAPKLRGGMGELFLGDLLLRAGLFILVFVRRAADLLLRPTTAAPRGL